MPITELRTRLPDSLAQQVRRVAADEDRSISAVVRRALQLMLAEREASGEEAERAAREIGP